MLSRVYCSLVLIISITQTAWAQDTLYARKVIADLCSTEMAGRGYVNDGDAAAAHYIKQEFELLGLTAFDFNFYQDFTFSVNTFPGRASLSLDGKALKPGQHFIIQPQCTGFKGKFDVKKLDSLAWDSLLKNPMPQDGMIGLSKMPISANKDFNASVQSGAAKIFPAMLWQRERLTWSVATETNPDLQLDIVDSVLSTTPLLAQIDFETKLKKHRTQNVIAYFPGTEQPDSFLVFTAHYDHLGMMGKEAIFKGANDNASGVSMLLQMAKYFQEHKPKYSVAFIAFAGEEAGLKGSDYYVKHPLFPLSQIKFLLNLDLMGTGNEGITVVNATEFPKQFSALEKINLKHEYLPQVKKRGKAANSDHYHFTEKGVPAFFIYTLGGIKAYHDVFDIPETLPLSKYKEVFLLLRDFSLQLMGGE